MTDVKRQASIGPLTLNILDRADSRATDYWDGNWLVVEASCRSGRTFVSASGAIIHLPELARWCHELRRMHNSLEGQAVLHCMEPNLGVNLLCSRTGTVEGQIMITPDPQSESHQFFFTCDQTYLPPLIAQLEAILSDFAIIGKP